MRLTNPRCGNALVLRVLQPEDRMAEYHDVHPAPNVDVAFVSVRGVAVRLTGPAMARVEEVEEEQEEGRLPLPPSSELLLRPDVVG